MSLISNITSFVQAVGSDVKALWAAVNGKPSLGETSTTAYRGDRGKTAYDHSQVSHAYLPLSGGTVAGNLTASKYFPAQDGVLSTNLGAPTVTEMAIFEGQYDNKTWFYPFDNLTLYTSADNGANWDVLAQTDDQKKRLLALSPDHTSSTLLTNGTTKFRFILRNTGFYVFASHLYIYCSTNGNSFSVQILKKKDTDSGWTNHTSVSNTVSNWPGHVTMSFPNIPWSLRTDTPSHFNEICIEITPTWSTANNISFYHLGLWGGYPAGRRTIYSWDMDKKVTFPNTIATPTGNSDQWTAHLSAPHAPVDRLTSTDNRTVKPNTTGIGTAVTAIKAFFTSRGGLNSGSGDTDYQDLLVLDTYSDASGGKTNALAFDKSEMLISHYQAQQADALWGVPKYLAYTDSNITGNAASATKLQTSRNISGVAFDGTANIELDTSHVDDTTGRRYVTDQEKSDITTAATHAGSKHALVNFLYKNGNYTAVSGDKIIADTAAGTFTILLPATPQNGDCVVVVDGADFSVHNLVLGRNGSTIEGASEDLEVDIAKATVTLVHSVSTWRVSFSVGVESTASPMQVYVDTEIAELRAEMQATLASWNTELGEVLDILNGEVVDIDGEVSELLGDD